MGRRTKPAKAKVQGKRLPARKRPKNGGSSVRDLEKRLAETLEQQTATSDILRVISSSPTDVQPVFDAIAKSVMRLCAGDFSNVVRYQDDLLHLAAYAHVGVEGVDTMKHLFPIRPSRELVMGRAVLDGTVAHIPDVMADIEYNHSFGEALRVRSIVGVPMLREGRAIGAISVWRAECRPFSDRQIALLQTFADQAVIAIENVRLFKELEARNRDLTATGEILRVIASSPTDAQPVFDTIVRSAVLLSDAMYGSVIRFDGELMHLAAGYHYTPEVAQALYEAFPMRPSPRMMSGRAILARDVVEVEDAFEDPEYAQGVAQAGGFRSMLAAPMLRDGRPIGAIVVNRGQPGRFSPTQIELLKTFADQAVIAIENVRLFTELQTSNCELTRALDTQTATSDILRVISGSRTEVQPVFDAILGSALRLLGGYSGGLTRVSGGQLVLSALTSTDSAADVLQRTRYPQLVDSSDDPHAYAVRTRAPLNVADMQGEARFSDAMVAAARARGFHSLVAVPLLRDDEPLGAISITRREVGTFTDEEVALLKTFADQAVIAIENVRLFRELEARNRDLTEALDKQTATSDILRVISQSQTDAQPVFETIVRNAVRLCGAIQGGVYRFDGELVHAVAHEGFTPQQLEDWRRNFPRPVTAPGTINLAIRTRTVIRIDDIEADPSIMSTGTVANLRSRGSRSTLAVPMIRQGDIIGAIALAHREVAAFSNAHVELLKTFADQAVIAIENVRLFKELEVRTQDLTRSVGELRALGEVGQAISSILDLDTVLTTIVSRAVQLSGLDGGVVFEYDEGAEEFTQRAAAETGGVLAQARRGTRYRKGEGVLGRTAITLEPAQVPDITVPGAYDSRVRENLIESGVRAVLQVPMIHQGRLIGCLGVTRNRPGDFPAETIELLRTFATQSALAIQNARLFLEIADKSRQLEAASRYKSEFLANMSHELRTPLNAVIGFSEVLLQRMFGELNAKQDEYLKDIYASGQHLLSLINDILDLSKIEAGRMELAPAPFHLPSALENAITLVRERAARHGITLEVDVDPRLGALVGDERKVKQVLLNLLSNAVKFTPEGGRVSLKAGRRDGVVEIAVTDTGIGIAPEDQAAIFEEFRQVGSDETRKQEGTGLGLTLAKKFVELHGGRIWVESEPGRGSTFTFTLPVS